MVETEGRPSSLTAIRVSRVSLVDELEGRIDRLLETLVNRQVFTRDDREEVLCQPGPRSRVRKVLDILGCKGEEAARVFLAISGDTRGEEPRLSAEIDGPSADYIKACQKHKDVLRRRSESMLFYNTRHGEKILFSEHYVNLLLVDGHQGLEMKRHEVLTFGQKRLSMQQRTAPHRKIAPDQLFSGSRPVKKVLVTGVAGIGKTVLVQKMLFDFGRSQSGLAFDFVLHLTFRDLNLIDKPTNFRDLVLRKNRHLAKELDRILANDDKLLVVLDGFDECRHYGSFDADVLVSEADEEAEVVEVVASLMQGELLPNASVLLTSRPAALGHVPVGCVDRFVLIAGFSLTEVRDFFRRYFQDGALADRMFAAVSANELMLTLCYIPAFCYIVCCILRESEDLCGESPRTMTDIYVQYLVALIRSHTRSRAETFFHERGGGAERLSDMVAVLGRLAFQKLMEHQTLFYGSEPEVAALGGCDLASTFLDKTVAQEPGCTEEVYSFTHLTIQEFFAALYCAVSDQPLPEALRQPAGPPQGAAGGHLDLFHRFLSGILSERNARLLSRHLGLRYAADKADAHRQRVVAELRALCENGAHVLNHLHCLFELQDPALALAVRPRALRVNVGDETLSQMDHNAIRYFLSLAAGRIIELDLTGTGVSAEALAEMRPLLVRCEQLWLGENTLDMESVQVIADVLRASDVITHLGVGWSDIGDDELIALSEAIRVKKRLVELWMEGNRVSHRGLLSLADLTPEPLEKVVAVWNGVTDPDPESWRGQDSITVDFTDDHMWEAWGEWVFRRCEVSSNEKLVTVLRKVCNISARCLQAPWAQSFYGQMAQLVRLRAESCTEDDMCKKLRKFQNVLDL